MDAKETVLAMSSAIGKLTWQLVAKQAERVQDGALKQ